MVIRKKCGDFCFAFKANFYILANVTTNMAALSVIICSLNVFLLKCGNQYILIYGTVTVVLVTVYLVLFPMKFL